MPASRIPGSTSLVALTGLVAPLRIFAYTLVATPRVASIDRKRVRHSILAIWATLVILYVLLRSWRLTSYGLWDDEVFSVRTAQVSWSELFGLIATDAVHPPFFYVLLKLWIAGGGATLLWLKLLPLVVSIGALLPFWLLCRELNLNLAEITLTFWLMAVNGHLIYYSQELRMYSLLFCLSLWSLWLFFRLLNAERASFRIVVTLFMVNVLLVYTHYFGWLFVGSEWLCVLLWRRRLLAGFSVSLILLAVVFAPWAYVVATYSSSGYVLPASLAGRRLADLNWISKPGLAELLWFLAILNGFIPWRHTTSLGIILFGLPIALAFYRNIRSRQRPGQATLNILAVFSFAPVAVAFIASQLMRHSMWGERYLIIVTLSYLLLVAVSLSYVRPVSARIALMALIVTWTAVAGAVGVFLSEGRIPWKSLVQHMIEQEGPSYRHVPVYTFEPWAAGPLDFSLADLGNHHFEVVVTESRFMTGEHFWVAFRDTTLRAGDDPRDVLEQRGCRIDAERAARDGAQRVVLFRATC
jgi:uncharacterized membrane protein